MPVTDVTTDPEALTMVVTADFTAPVERLWTAHADPRQIERFWGPPGHPATFTRHDVAAGGASQYYMTGPDGTQFHGRWDYLSLVEGESFTVTDRFTDSSGVADESLPATEVQFEFSATETGSRLVTTSRFASADDLSKLIEMGMREGMVAAFGQMDDVLADLASFSAIATAQSQLIGDTQARVSRIIRGTVEQVWRAHHEPELMKQWLLGPDGWEMTECRVAAAVGDTYRNAWAPVGDTEGEAFALGGELLESDPPHREVTTESMEGIPGEPARNELTLAPVPEGTLMTLLITYPSADVREMVLGTGMVGGMEVSFARLESLL